MWGGFLIEIFFYQQRHQMTARSFWRNAEFLAFMPATGVHFVYTRWFQMATIKVGVREFRERIAAFLESDTPVAVTRRGETLGIYVPTRRKTSTADISELKAAADRLATALADLNEEEIVAEFRHMRRPAKRT